MEKRPYHKYVFNTEKKVFVGKFEEMYQNEEKECFDSWFQEDLRSLTYQISLSILNRHNFSKILDIGCGKGTFTHLLKKENNFVEGIDISGTAIKKAKAKFPDIEFKVKSIEKLEFKKKFDLVILMEILSYLKNWNEVIKKVAQISKYIYITLYLPPNPIGFVKSFDELRNELYQYYDIKVDVVINGQAILLLGDRK